MPTEPVAHDTSAPAGPDGSAARARTGQVVPSVLRAARMLDAFADGPAEATLAALSRRLELPRSSTLSLCNSLVEAGLLERGHDGAYRLGPHILELSRAFLRQTDLHTEFQRAVAELDVLPEQTIVCAVLRDHDVVYIGRRPGSIPLGVSYEVGMSLPAHCAASGLAMLSAMPDEWLTEHYSEPREAPLRPLTSRSITTVAELRDRVTEIRPAGYAIDDEETALGMICVGVAVRDSTAAPVGAVAVSLAKGAMPRRQIRAVAAEVQRLAHRISTGLGAPPA
jgi:DNA-binding IclR family transcriptional regulator